MKKLYDAVVTTGTYKDKQGQEKKRYMNVGKVFEGDKGLSLLLEAIPLGITGPVWVNFYEPKESGSAPGAKSAFDDDLAF
jgi:hypothetical protein